MHPYPCTVCTPPLHSMHPTPAQYAGVTPLLSLYTIRQKKSSTFFLDWVPPLGGVRGGDSGSRTANRPKNRGEKNHPTKTPPGGRAKQHTKRRRPPAGATAPEGGRSGRERYLFSCYFVYVSDEVMHIKSVRLVSSVCSESFQERTKF